MKRPLTTMGICRHWRIKAVLKDARFFLQNVHWHVALFFCACACFHGMDGIQDSHFVCSMFFQFWSHIKPLESYSLERNENDVAWNHAPGVRQELEEERKKHSESKEGAHAANLRWTLQRAENLLSYVTSELSILIWPLFKMESWMHILDEDEWKYLEMCLVYIVLHFSPTYCVFPTPAKSTRY